MQLFANNAETYADAAIGSGDTSVTLADGASFPTVIANSGDYFLFTIDNGASIEICKCELHTAASITLGAITRAQENTSAGTFASGTSTKVALRLTSATAESFRDLIGTILTDSNGILYDQDGAILTS